jgi:hypothetical protein
VLLLSALLIRDHSIADQTALFFPPHRVFPMAHFSFLDIDLSTREVFGHELLLDPRTRVQVRWESMGKNAKNLFFTALSRLVEAWEPDFAGHRVRLIEAPPQGARRFATLSIWPPTGEDETVTLRTLPLSRRLAAEAELEILQASIQAHLDLESLGGAAPALKRTGTG